MTTYKKPLSPSSINTYLNCPYSWYLKYIRGIKIESGDAAIFGSFIHKVYEYFWEFYTPGLNITSAVINATDKYTLSPKDTHPNIDPEYESTTHTCLENFISNVEKYPTYIPLYRELKCVNPHNDTVSIIDVVYKNKIVDYKTSTQYTIKPKLPNEIQATMCSQNLLKVYDIDLKNVEFWYVRFNKYQNVTVDISLIEKVNNIIEDVRESVKEDKFPKNETNCFFCDYKLICESEKKHNKNRMVNLK